MVRIRKKLGFAPSDLQIVEPNVERIFDSGAIAGLQPEPEQCLPPEYSEGGTPNIPLYVDDVVGAKVKD